MNWFAVCFIATAVALFIQSIRLGVSKHEHRATSKQLDELCEQRDDIRDERNAIIQQCDKRTDLVSQLTRRLEDRRRVYGLAARSKHKLHATAGVLGDSFRRVEVPRYVARLLGVGTTFYVASPTTIERTLAALTDVAHDVDTVQRLTSEDRQTLLDAKLAEEGGLKQLEALLDDDGF